MFTEMVPEGLVIDTACGSQEKDKVPLYFCLRVGRPADKRVSDSAPINSYSKKKRPEYWFSIPWDKWVNSWQVYSVFTTLLLWCKLPG